MRNSTQFIVILLSTVLLSFLLPWWVIAPISFLVPYLAKAKPSAGFFTALLAVFFGWLMVVFYLDDGSVRQLAGNIFEAPALAMPLVSAVIGGLVAGFFGLAGGLLSSDKKKWVNS